MQLNQILLDLKGLVSEPVRCEIARRFVAEVNRACREQGLSEDQVLKVETEFLASCDCHSGSPEVPDNFFVKATDLAEFCARWITIQKYKDDEWKPISPEMNSIRVTMVEELKDIAAKPQFVWLVVKPPAGSCTVIEVFATEHEAARHVERESGKYYDGLLYFAREIRNDI